MRPVASRRYRSSGRIRDIDGELPLDWMDDGGRDVAVAVAVVVVVVVVVVDFCCVCGCGAASVRVGTRAAIVAVAPVCVVAADAVICAIPCNGSAEREECMGMLLGMWCVCVCVCVYVDMLCYDVIMPACHAGEGEHYEPYITYSVICMHMHVRAGMRCKTQIGIAGQACIVLCDACT